MNLCFGLAVSQKLKVTLIYCLLLSFTYPLSHNLIYLIVCYILLVFHILLEYFIIFVNLLYICVVMASFSNRVKIKLFITQVYLFTWLGCNNAKQ